MKNLWLLKYDRLINRTLNIIYSTGHLVIQSQQSLLGNPGFVCNNLRLHIYSLSCQNVFMATHFAMKQIIKYVMLVIMVKYCKTEVYSEPCQTSKIFFFYQGFLSRALTTQGIAGEGRGLFFIALYHFHSLMNTQTFICNFACEMTITYF